ncbi:ribulose-phosphate 3-epimerase [Desulfurobacterium atlanticum]|uniref:Ribulose-phosphate 3-epimerase n=1 Tax=Desulfurobacterium atlanticum TaxID=240169 RepID=A0A238ZKN2_9BACT|nr:ribulose-phosphate 3-epimerase [Desulfurobacterium atlanticum]SNR83621.1 ribulose-phosphate 3-epimerase [Desulfurobacterium atlanticum]
MALLAPSILSADFANLQRDIKEAVSAGADIIHIDVMDGRFVPNLTIGPCVVESIRKVTDVPFDVHLMIVEPDRYIKDFVSAGADWISVHVEAAVHLHRTVSMIKEFDKKAGVVLNPATPVFFIEDILPFVDFVLIMSVNPGFGGQKFIPQTISKVKKLNAIREKMKLDFLIEIDGGIKIENVKQVIDAGVDVVVAGSAVFKGDIKENVENFKGLIGG